MNRKLIAAVLLGALSTLSQSSMATAITLNGSIAAGTTLSQGSYTGQFDGKSSLPDSFKINSAAFVFDFADNQDNLYTTSSSPGTIMSAYNYAGTYYDGSSTHTWYSRNAMTFQEVRKTGAQESASVSLAGVNVGSGATSMTQTSSTSTSNTTSSLDNSYGYGGYYYNYSCGNRTCSAFQQGAYTDYYTASTSSITTYTTDWTGPFSVTGNIVDQSILDQLLMGQQLNFGLAIGGDLVLTGAHLYLDVTEIARANVPEPSSVLLMGLGLAGLMAHARRRRMKK